MQNLSTAPRLGGKYEDNNKYEDETKYFDNNLTSMIDNDYLLNYVEGEQVHKRALHVPTLFSQASGELQLPFNTFPDYTPSAEALQNIYGKYAFQQESWFPLTSSEPPKMHSDPTSATFNYKNDISDDFDGSIKTKKIKTNKETELKRIAEIPSRNKNNIKNTYINKINSLITEPKESKRDRKLKAENGNKNDLKRTVEIRDSVPAPSQPGVKMGMKKIRSCDVLKSDELEKLNLKLAKNRESARNSRIRKKVYIDLLERTVEQLQTELTNTRKQLETSTNTASKSNFEAKPIANLYTGKQQLFDRLEKMMSTKADESEISFLIDSLRLRFGASGKDRVDAVNYMFKQIMEFLVPVHMKYLLWTAGTGKDLFSNGDIPGHSADNQNTEYYGKVASILSLTDNQRKHLSKYRKKLQGQKQKFESLISSMNQVRKSVLKQANSLQIVIDEFRNYLTPAQTGHLLVTLEKEKDRRELRADQLWSGTKREQDELSQESDTFLDGENMDMDSSSDEIDITGMNYSHNISAGTVTPVE